MLSALEESGADQIALEPDEQLSWLARSKTTSAWPSAPAWTSRKRTTTPTWRKSPTRTPPPDVRFLYDWLGYLQSALHNMR